MPTPAKTTQEYLALLPADRRAALAAVAATIRKHLPKGYEEAFGSGMPCWQVPLSVYPDTYNRQPLMYAALASQKSHMALYLMCAYVRPEVDALLRDGFRAAGKRLDMGRSCLRFQRLEDLPLDVIGRAIAATGVQDYVALARAARAGTAAGRRAAAQRPPRSKTVSSRATARPA